MNNGCENKFLNEAKEHVCLNAWIFTLASKVLDPYFISCVENREWSNAAVSIAGTFLGFFVFFGISIVVLDMFMGRKGRRFGKLENFAMAVLIFLLFLFAYYVVNYFLFV